MKILHYALGFPPYRTGGLTKFCIDLMTQQNKDGHQVALMWPGQMGFILKRLAIKDRGIVLVGNAEVQSFEVINPLPVSYDEGINNFPMFTQFGDKAVYSKLLGNYNPDIVHIHTFMGLHKSFLEAVKEKNIRLVFSAHDFFPICPKVTMFRKGSICGSIQSCKECVICNVTALKIKKIKILQTPLYRMIKDSAIIKKARKQHRDRYLSERTGENRNLSVGTAENFKELRAYYYSMLKLVDIVHYNSTVTKTAYESVFDLSNSCVIGITHRDIADNRKIKTFSSNKIHIRYLGPYSGAKGYFIMKAALDKLWNERQGFCLDIHFKVTETAPYIRVHDRYTYDNLEEIFEETDVLIAPSVWYETFGYTVLEAISYGVPVIISGTVGAKDILSPKSGIIIDNINTSKLYTIISELTVDKLKSMNKAIVREQKILTLPEMTKQIEKMCYS